RLRCQALAELDDVGVPRRGLVIAGLRHGARRLRAGRESEAEQSDERDEQRASHREGSFMRLKRPVDSSCSRSASLSASERGHSGGRTGPHSMPRKPMTALAAAWKPNFDSIRINRTESNCAARAAVQSPAANARRIR